MYVPKEYHIRRYRSARLSSGYRDPACKDCRSTNLHLCRYQPVGHWPSIAELFIHIHLIFELDPNIGDKLAACIITGISILGIMFIIVYIIVRHCFGGVYGI